MSLEYYMNLLESSDNIKQIERIPTSNGLKIYHCLKYDSTYNLHPIADIFLLDLNDLVLEEYSFFDSRIKSEKSFYQLQEDVLASYYFEHNSDLRWNMYLYLVYDNNETLSKIHSTKQLEEDDNYAIKFFISHDELLNTYKLTNDLWFYDFVTFKPTLKNSSNGLILAEWSNKINNLKGDAYDRLLFLINDLHLSDKDIADLGVIRKIISLKFKDFRTHCFPRNFELDFGQVNVFYGENGSGKSSVLDAIKFALIGAENKNINSIDNSFLVATVLETNNEIETTSVYSNKITSEKRMLLNKKWYDSDSIDESNLKFNFDNHTFISDDIVYKYAIREERHNVKKLFYRLIVNEQILNAQDEIFKLSKEYDKKLFELDKRKKKNTIEYKELNYNYQILKELSMVPHIIEQFVENYGASINTLFKQIHRPLEFEGIFINDMGEILTKRISTSSLASASEMSAGQKASLAMSTLLVMHCACKNSPRILLLDEPVINFDLMHTVHFLNIIRSLALSGTQIFFTTTNKDIASYMRKLFSFMEKDFKLFRLERQSNSTNLFTEKIYSPISVVSEKVIKEPNDPRKFVNDIYKKIKKDIQENNDTQEAYNDARDKAISITKFSKPLSIEEEKILFELLYSGDTSAKEKLVEHNLRLVAHIAKKYKRLSLENDIISVGSIGLIKAINTYKFSSTIRFSSYAARCIENEILMYLRSIKKYTLDISMDEPIGVEFEGNEVFLSDKIPSDSDNLINALELAETYAELKKNMETKLNAREKIIISLRYGLEGEGEKTQTEIAEILEISRSYVSRIEKSALKKLRNEMKKSETELW